MSLNSIFYKTPQNVAASIPLFIKKDFTLRDTVQYSSLLEKWGKYKILPKGFEMQALIALSYYPELKDIPIKFEIKEALFPLSSRPDPVTLVIPGMVRKYKITISNKSLQEYNLILLNKLPFNAQIGVIGHELAHISYYINRSAIDIAIVGFRYLTSFFFRKKFENSTDYATIDHGLGYQLLTWRLYFEKLISLKKFDANSTKFYFENRYLNSFSIRNIIKYKYPK